MRVMDPGEERHTTLFPPWHGALSPPPPNCMQVPYPRPLIPPSFYPQMDRMHPKSFGTLGRVRIQLRKEDGSLASMTIQNRRVLLRKIGSLLPDIQPSMPRSENDDLPPHIAAMLDSMPDDEEDEDEEEGGEKSKKALKGSSSGDAGPLPSSAGAIEASLSPSPSTTTPSGGGKKKRGKKRR